MFTMLGSKRRCCDGITRRETLKVGALSALGGFGLPQLLQAKAEGRAKEGQAKSVILLYLLGGAATQDMWDMKPKAPSEVRGEFQPIDTNVPGIQICEHLPRMARWMHKAALVRTVNHKAGCHNCLPVYTGWEVPPPDQHPRDIDPPSMGSICEYLRQGRGELPDYLYLPCWLGCYQAFRRAGPYGGFLGKRYDPLTTECQPYMAPGAPAPSPGSPQPVLGKPILPNSTLEAGLTVDRLSRRRGLLDQIDDQIRQAELQAPLVSFSKCQEQAFDILMSSKLRECFDIDREDPRLVDRYGRTLFGQSTLIARRLVEQGVRFVNVTWDLFWGPVNIDYDAWDTHQQNFKILRENKLPPLDQTYTALMQDLEDRGLLDETLVVVMSEMGRTPRVNGNAGRDHWTFCYSVMLAGAGIRGGAVYGVSDDQAAYVKDKPASTADICATIYRCLGIDPELRVPDRTNRPVDISHGGRAIEEILA
ncbi:MAG: DUF1501 domain-containing protein [Planctomycetia bacterium]|nr:DUF1501 domain-containing protein [Planctomycetia bacterium]